MCAFAKRLRHLGFDAYFLHDSTIPKVESGDLLIVGSGSGETASILAIVEIAAAKGMHICLITSSETSSMRKLANVVFYIQASSKLSTNLNLSIQPMTSLFEQVLFLSVDTLVLMLRDQLGETNDSMKQRHNVLE
jgi:6-phospho-3-hexuloisomerase